MPFSLGNGTLSWATAYVKFTGTNDGPVITSGTQAGSVQEDLQLTATGRSRLPTSNGGPPALCGQPAAPMARSRSTPATALDLHARQRQPPEPGAGREHDEVFTVTVTDDFGATTTRPSRSPSTAPTTRR